MKYNNQCSKKQYIVILVHFPPLLLLLQITAIGGGGDDHGGDDSDDESNISVWRLGAGKPRRYIKALLYNNMLGGCTMYIVQ